MKTVAVSMPLKEKDREEMEQKFPGYHFIFCEPNTLSRHLSQAEIIIGQPSIGEIKEAKRLEWVQLGIAGVDRYVGKPGLPEGICLTNATGAFGQSISEHLLVMALSLYKKMHLYRDQQKEGIWRDRGKEKTLFGKTALIVGTGDIGRSFARILEPFHTKNIGIRRVARERLPYFDAVYTAERLDDLLPEADIVALCLPSTPLTRGLMDKKRLLRMKEDGVLLNVGRGDVVILDDLVSVMEGGHLHGAGLDVAEQEPLPARHPLWRLENVVITPHVSGGSFGHLDETYEKILEICMENLRRHEAGEPLKNQVDFSTGYCESH